MSEETFCARNNLYFVKTKDKSLVFVFEQLLDKLCCVSEREFWNMMLSKFFFFSSGDSYFRIF